MRITKGLKVLCLLLCAVAVSAQYNQPMNSNDFFILTRTWGPEECDEKACSNPPVARFTVHGLWPNYKNGGYPSDCVPSNKFSTSQLPQPLLNQMSCEWVSYRGSNAGFWSYEWDKHGSCALPVLKTQSNYFNTAIDLHNKYEPNEALMNAGIDITKTGSYSLSQLQGAFQKSWGVKSVISCNSQDFYEVWMCVDSSLRPINCPSSVKGRPCSTNAGFVAGSPVPSTCTKYYESNSSSTGGSMNSTGGTTGTGTGGSSTGGSSTYKPPTSGGTVVGSTLLIVVVISAVLTVF